MRTTGNWNLFRNVSSSKKKRYRLLCGCYSSVCCLWFNCRRTKEHSWINFKCQWFSDVHYKKFELFRLGFTNVRRLSVEAPSLNLIGLSQQHIVLAKGKQTVALVHMKLFTNLISPIRSVACSRDFCFHHTRFFLFVNSLIFKKSGLNLRDYIPQYFSSLSFFSSAPNFSSFCFCFFFFFFSLILFFFLFLLLLYCITSCSRCSCFFYHSS